MIVHEACLNFQLVRYGDDEPLTTTKLLLAYLTNGIADDPHESFWIACMDPKRRPICRMRMAAGPQVAATVGVRQVIRAMILSEAMAVACLRTERTAITRPNLADARLLWTLRETTRLMNMDLVDYFVARLNTPKYHSWRENEEPAV